MQILTMKSPSLESWGSGLASHWRHRTGSSERRANSRQGERIVSLYRNSLVLRVLNAHSPRPQPVCVESQIPFNRSLLHIPVDPCPITRCLNPAFGGRCHVELSLLSLLATSQNIRWQWTEIFITRRKSQSQLQRFFLFRKRWQTEQWSAFLFQQVLPTAISYNLQFAATMGYQLSKAPAHQPKIGSSVAARSDISFCSSAAPFSYLPRLLPFLTRTFTDPTASDQ